MGGPRRGNGLPGGTLQVGEPVCVRPYVPFSSVTYHTPESCHVPAGMDMHRIGIPTRIPAFPG